MGCREREREGGWVVRRGNLPERLARPGGPSFNLGVGSGNGVE